METLDAKIKIINSNNEVLTLREISKIVMPKRVSKIVASLIILIEAQYEENKRLESELSEN